MKEEEKANAPKVPNALKDLNDPKDLNPAPPAPAPPMFRDEAAAPADDGAPVPYPTFLENLSSGFWDF